ncbi:MAG: hypothetical protein ACMXYE_00625 [Candidatus Woesearchaeota archaeon]
MADLVTGLALVEGFGRVIPALLVLLVVFALLETTKVMGKNHSINVLIALAVALLILLSGKAAMAIAIMTPWFVVLFFGVLFTIIGFKAIGFSDSAILGVFKEFKGIPWVLGFVAVIIIIISVGQVLGPDLLAFQGSGNETAAQPGQPGAQGQSTDYTTNLVQTIFHPKVLSFALLGLIAAFTVLFMTSTSRA